MLAEHGIEYRFTRAQRLLKSVEFDAVFRGRCCRQGKFLRLCLKREKQPFSRLGVVVGKRHLRTAVGRNRIKRLVRETFRLHQHVLLPGDYVVRLDRKIQPIQHDEMVADLLILFQQVAKCHA